MSPCPTPSCRHLGSLESDTSTTRECSPCSLAQLTLECARSSAGPLLLCNARPCFRLYPQVGRMMKTSSCPALGAGTTSAAIRCVRLTLTPVTFSDSQKHHIDHLCCHSVRLHPLLREILHGRLPYYPESPAEYRDPSHCFESTDETTHNQVNDTAHA